MNRLIRYFYDNNGTITFKINASIAMSEGQWIDSEQSVRISDYKVNVETKQLEPK
jgi:hypothetical protein